MDHDHTGRARPYSICRVRIDGRREEQDPVALERPLEISVNGRLLYTCLHTPGDEAALALALCYQDGIIGSPSDARAVMVERQATLDSVRVEMAENRSPVAQMEPRLITSSQAGISSPGRALLKGGEPEPVAAAANIASERLFAIRRDFLERQTLFRLTGATHAAALYDAEGVCLALAEDVGRHNALDKCIGKMFLAGTLERVCLAMLSSRISYEMIFKLHFLRVPVVAGFSAPTSMTVDFARAANMTLIGFFRNERFNLYSQPARIGLPATS